MMDLFQTPIMMASIIQCGNCGQNIVALAFNIIGQVQERNPCALRVKKTIIAKRKGGTIIQGSQSGRQVLFRRRKW